MVVDEDLKWITNVLNVNKILKKVYYNNKYTIFFFKTFQLVNELQHTHTHTHVVVSDQTVIYKFIEYGL